MVQYRMIQYGTAWYSMVQNDSMICIILYHSVPYCINTAVGASRPWTVQLSNWASLLGWWNWNGILRVPAIFLLTVHVTTAILVSLRSDWWGDWNDTKFDPWGAISIFWSVICIRKSMLPIAHFGLLNLSKAKKPWLNDENGSRTPEDYAQAASSLPRPMDRESEQVH